MCVRLCVNGVCINLESKCVWWGVGYGAGEGSVPGQESEALLTENRPPLKILIQPFFCWNRSLDPNVTPLGHYLRRGAGECDGWASEAYEGSPLPGYLLVQTGPAAVRQDPCYGLISQHGWSQSVERLQPQLLSPLFSS